MTDTAKIGRFRRRPRTTTLILLASVIASWFGVVRLWIMHRDLEDRLEEQEIRRASDAAAINTWTKTIDDRFKATNVDDLRAEHAETRRRVESLCLPLATIARLSTGAERLAGDTEWCPVTMPKRTGEGRIWRKHGWDVTAEEAARIRSKFQ